MTNRESARWCPGPCPRPGQHDLVLLDLMRSGLDQMGGAGLTVKVGRRRSRGTFTPMLKATSGSIAYQATTLTVK